MVYGIYSSSTHDRKAVPVWKYILNGRRMVLNEKEDLDNWLDFAAICRVGGAPYTPYTLYTPYTPYTLYKATRPLLSGC